MSTPAAAAAKLSRLHSRGRESFFFLFPGHGNWLFLLKVAGMPDLGARRWWALGAVSLAILCVGVDSTVLSVALPTLARALHASESDLQWFSSGYLLVLAAAMLPAGLLGDRYGRKKVMLISLGLFGAGSAACAYSTSSGEFMAARMLVGRAGAGVTVMAITALTVLFSKEERPKAVGVWASANFLALPIGPVLRSEERRVGKE